MLRREFLAASVAAPALWSAPKAFDMSRISFITDETSASPDDAVAFAKKFGLKWVELREVPGAKDKTYSSLSEPELKAAAKRLREAGLKVAFFNSGGTKYPLPGTEPVNAAKMAAGWREKAQLQFDQRAEQMRRQIAASHAFDCNLLRVFAFARVTDAEKLFPRIADVLGELGEIAKKEGSRLLLENEPACNVGSCAELAGLIKLLPESTFGMNWDANNGQSMKERPFPDGYALLPKKRIEHVHMHGRTLLDPEKILDWRTIFAALVQDGFKGKAGLETHYFDGTKIEKSHLCMKELQRITGAAS